MNKALGERFLLSVASMLCSLVVLAGFASGQVNVTTWQIDTLRTGRNMNETILSPSNLTSGNFGELCSAGLDGQVYAQPLVLSNITFMGTQYASLVYVVTQMNTLYVINGTPPAQGNPCGIVASLSLTPANQYPVDCHYVGGGGCQTIGPVVGAVGTPVIQSVANSNGTLYVVTETQDQPAGQMPTNWYHYLHAVNLDQLVEETPAVRVAPPGPSIFPTEDSYWSRHHVQRPGLLLINSYLYIAFSMMDGLQPVFNGALFRYDVSNLNIAPLHFQVTPDLLRDGGGIWQGGAGLAYGPDESATNYIYFNTGDGSWDGVHNFGDSFIKLDPNLLQVVDYFTPSDQSYRNCQNPFNDIDFGSGGVMLTPADSNQQYMAVTDDKEGGLWAIDRGTPGRFNLGQCSSGCTQCPTAEQDNQNIQTVWLGSNGKKAPNMHNTAAYWNNFIYIAPISNANPNSAISQYALCAGSQPFCSPPVFGTINGLAIKATYGATPTVSASSQTSNGILWVTVGNFSAQSTLPGTLYAFDATTMAGLYVNTGTGSPCSQVDALAPIVKFAVPTVANGYVYLGTQALTNGVNTGAGTFYIFGLGRQCTQNNRAKSRPAIAKPVPKLTR